MWIQESQSKDKRARELTLLTADAALSDLAKAVLKQALVVQIREN